jgi:histidine ammonia-lyase
MARTRKSPRPGWARHGTPLALDGETLTPEDVWDVAWRKRPVRLAPEAKARMAASRSVVERAARGDAPVYGVNTGFGALAEIKISTEEIRALQRNLLLSHCAGVGEPLPTDAVRAMMLLRANVLARGYSGARPLLAERLLTLLNREVHPVVPSQGSVGASGDLAPLAHLGAVLIGQGEAIHRGLRLPASEALRRARIPAVRLEAKEGLALVNGTQAMTGLGVLALGEAIEVLRAADIAGAMSLDAILGTPRAFDPRLADLRPHPGHAACARNLRNLLAGSEIAESHRESLHKVQDPYSLRCMPQVHGAARDVVAFVRQVLEREINAATDNPLVFADTGEILSGGNFHGQPVAHALDFLACALADLASISERRIEQLVNPQLSGLPAFLTEEGGLNSGFMMAQVTASALLSELKLCAVPAAVDSIPSSANREDHVSMGMTAARKARTATTLARRILAIEILCAAQGLDFRRPLRSGPGVEAAHAVVRRQVAHLSHDRALHRDIEAVESLLRSGDLVAAADQAAGGIG